jgi:diaminopimelate epimerase
MRYHFWKMHGAANDFILVDDRAQTFPAGDRAWLAKIMSRRTGVGSEGILLIQPAQAGADFRMRFFNPDGGEAEMCGNGARCVARLAHDLRVAPDQMKFETAAGIVGAEIRGGNVLLHMTEPRDWRMHRTLELDGRSFPYHFVNSGVPHAVVEVKDLDAVDVQSLGSQIRHHRDFAPAGTNANFIAVTGPDSIRVRTYERGVEAETLACGTGIVASGLIAGRLGRAKTPVHVRPASGDTLEVSYTATADGATAVTLLGPAVHVFEGTIEHP